MLLVSLHSLAVSSDLSWLDNGKRVLSLHSCYPSDRGNLGRGREERFQTWSESGLRLACKPIGSLQKEWRGSVNYSKDSNKSPVCVSAIAFVHGVVLSQGLGGA